MPACCAVRAVSPPTCCTLALRSRSCCACRRSGATRGRRRSTRRRSRCSAAGGRGWTGGWASTRTPTLRRSRPQRPGRAPRRGLQLRQRLVRRTEEGHQPLRRHDGVLGVRVPHHRAHDQGKAVHPAAHGDDVPVARALGQQLARGAHVGRVVGDHGRHAARADVVHDLLQLVCTRWSWHSSGRKSWWAR